MLKESTTIDNRKMWYDSEGNPIHAHGGGILQEGDYFYWFGENRNGGKKVSCYRSLDLIHWEFRNDVLSLDSTYSPVYYRTFADMDPHQILDNGYGSGAVIERPKVLFNQLTRKYVMWMHWENGKDYCDARCAVATCDIVDGDYVYHGSFNPIGHMSRDCTLFQDDNGSAYFISAARDNADLMLYRLSDDYLSIDEHKRTLWPGQYREAPAVFKRGEYYFLISSACTGWYPNQATYAYATSLTGNWSPLFNLGSSTTFDSQPAFVIRIKGKEQNTYVYVGDRWDPTDYSNSSYIYLPLEFPSDTSVVMNWSSTVTIDTDSGTVKGESVASGMWRIYCNGSDQYLVAGVAVEGVNTLSVSSRKLSYADEFQKWKLVETGHLSIRIKHVSSQKWLEPFEQSSADGVQVVLTDERDHPAQEWEIFSLNDGWYKLINRHTRKVLTIAGGEGEILKQTEIQVSNDTRRGGDPQLFLIGEIY